MSINKMKELSISFWVDKETKKVGWEYVGRYSDGQESGGGDE